jgi:hypothetical protein
VLEDVVWWFVGGEVKESRLALGDVQLMQTVAGRGVRASEIAPVPFHRHLSLHIDSKCIKV